MTGLLKQTIDFLTENGIQNAKYEGLEIVACAAKLTINDIYLIKAGVKKHYLSEEERRLIKIMTERRIKNEPLQYILGNCEFFGRMFFVKKGVLIPRADTETLIYAVLASKKEGSVLDLCSGSGCIGITLALEGSFTSDCCDISDIALKVMQSNAAFHKVHINIIKHDIFKDTTDAKYDIITCNPPYIKTDEIPFLQREVLQEPVSALDGGEDGLIFYRTIIKKYKKSLKDGGSIFFECGINQSEEVAELLKNNGYSSINIKKDSNGIERTVWGTVQC